MAFTPRTDWVPDPDQPPTKPGMTPITADDMIRIEKGIADAHETADSAAAAGHKHAAGDIDSGTFSTARIPNLAISKVTGLQDALDALSARLEAVESPDE